MESETPRTDAQASVHDECDPSVPSSAGYNDLLNHARQLERELTAANLALKEVREEVRRMVAALDAAYNHNEAARAAVVQHYGLHHSPVVLKFIKALP